MDARIAFIKIKSELSSAPILALPDFSEPFEIHCDASDVGVGAMLLQKQNGVYRVIAYFSAKLTPAQQRYSTTEKECLAVILSIEKFRIYIDGTRFTVYTDHASLLWLHRFKESNGRLVRWALRLQSYDFELKHRKGKSMQMPDALSRVHEIDAIDFDSFQSSNDKNYHELIDKTLMNDQNTSEFVIRNDMLYKRMKGKNDEFLQLYVPNDRIEQALHECHDANTAAHGGFFKTRFRVRQNYYWPGMDNDIRKYVGNCTVCKQSKQASYNLSSPMGNERSPSRPWEMIAIDFVGPLPRSKNGNRWILTIVDCFSKFSVIATARDATAAFLVKTLEEKVFLPYGVPERIICDNGSQFKSNLFSDFCKRYRVEVWYTPYYHAQANPSEAVNKIIGTSIRCYIDKENHKEWDKNLHFITCAINTSVHTATQKTPFEILYGQTHNISGQHSRLNENSRTHLKSNIDTIRENVSKQLTIAYERSKKHYNLRTKPISFAIGDIAYRRNFQLSNKATHFSAKLAPKYISGKIVGICGSNVYQFKDESSSTVGKYHVKDLKRN